MRSSTRIRKGIELLKARIGVDGLIRKLGDDLPLESVLYNADQLEQHASVLADWHQIDPRPERDRLLARLDANEQVLLEAYKLVTAAVENNRRISPASEWLLDNFHLIEEQIRTARRHLPKGYSRELPRLLNGPSAGYPRIYDLALELISHVDGRIDADSLQGFVSAYQRSVYLTLGELWAIPIMMRQALIENLRRVAARIAKGKLDRNLATTWADRFIECVETQPKNIVLVLADMARSNPNLSSAFIAELARRLQGRTSALAFPLTWIEQRLSEDGLSIEQMVRAEGQQQAVDQVSISNSIGSLRTLDAINWRTFVEGMSVVEQTLVNDPAGVYARMDFDTRDQYRHVVERIARRTKLPEHVVAAQACDLAREQALHQVIGHRMSHVGYFLIDKGLPELERAMRLRPTLSSRLTKSARRVSLGLFLGAIAVVTGATAGGVWSAVEWRGVLSWGVLLLLCVGASHLGVAVVNWLATLVVQPKRLPRLDFSSGIPDDASSLVAVPAMLISPRGIQGLLERLEVRYLANRDDNLRFCLLTDFRDAAECSLPEDESLLTVAREGIQALNAKYNGDDTDRFFLLHRPRLWNAQEKTWMGRERKRGKLAELNALLLGGAGNGFSCMVGDRSHLIGVKYVITLDADTHLPRDAARRLVGTLAHILNRPQIDERRKIVTDGYGVLQPGVGIALGEKRSSWFVRLYGGEIGIDPYTRVVSDVYQDVFQEGSFIGKGIYDVDAFSATTEDRFPENRILSHDLLEGCYARSGLVSDIHIYESHPARYASDVARRHRWIRGDFQIARWLLPRVPGGDGRSVPNPVSLLSRWKILDNLRRSAVPSALTLLLILGWLALPPAWVWTVAVVGIAFLPAFGRAVVSLFQKSSELPWLLHLRDVVASLGLGLAQAVLMLVFLPYEAYFSLDAIVRTGVRLLVSHTRMLEWKTANDAEMEASNDLAGSYRTMWISPALGMGSLVALAAVRPEALWAAAPLAALWILAPAVAWWISQPVAPDEAELTNEQVLFLHRVSRKTWRFFETFLQPADHWLPPDNFQEVPVGTIAHRTSPTNMGMSLLSQLAAYDFGYISAGQLLEGTRRTMESMNQLERFRGHFLNWYDTQSLQPLPPKYVSSVDSGNLAGHLMILRRGMLELPHQQIVSPRIWQSCSVTLQLLEQDQHSATGSSTGPAANRSMSGRPVDRLRELLMRTLERVPQRLSTARQRLQELHEAALNVCQGELTDKCLAGLVGDFERQCRSHLDDLQFLAPWIAHPPIADDGWRRGPPEQVQQLAALRESLLNLDENPKLCNVTNDAQGCQRLLEEILVQIAARNGAALPDEHSWFQELRGLLQLSATRATERLQAIEERAAQCGTLAECDYGFLYNPSRRLLSIGYDVSERRQDNGYYDLLASEARLASFVGIAQGHLEQEHWFALGRLLTTSQGQSMLLSWSGSMFEYLMPLLIMPTYENTLLDQTYKAVVDRQIEYGRQHGIPWGVSESGYNMTDAHLNYQYRAFGVPGLGFKRGLAEDVVIAPYATAMALMVAPGEACRNLQAMTAAGFEGEYGFYEAIDYTPSRMGRGKTPVIVRSFMAHHQGMSFLSLAHTLLNRPMQRRFQSEPLFQAAELLLQERVPSVAPFQSRAAEVSGSRKSTGERHALMRVFTTPNSPAPEVHLLSNGRYHVMVTNSGGGYSQWKGIAVTRWREDGTRDNAGSFCYVRDVVNGAVWSTTHQPTLKGTKRYEAIFSQARAEFRRRDDDIKLHTEIAVSPEDDVEIRRTGITNRSKTSRTLELTSYMEVVLASAASDATHPAFSNLFVQTEIIPLRQAIVCTRRPRSHREHPLWMVHLMIVRGATDGEASYETDRLKFIGRGGTLADPAALRQSGKLSNTEGPVLDPIVAIRHRLTIGPDETAIVDLVTGIAETRDLAIGLIDKYRDRHLADRGFDMAWTHAQVILRQLNVTEAEAQVFGRLASAVVYANVSQRADAAVLIRNRRGQSGLWGYGISGDLPIVLVRIGDTSKIDFVRQLVQAHAFWRLKGLAVDLVIWNEDNSGYRQALQDLIVGLITAGGGAHEFDRPGGIFVRRSEQMADEDRILLQTVARAVLSDSEGTLAVQVECRVRTDVALPDPLPVRSRRFDTIRDGELPRRDLIFFNGLGGFTPDGREYVIRMERGKATPAPWSNVFANAEFGSVISESGGAYTWGENAHEFRLTPWHNDPISDASGEACYLRDEENGQFWSPTPLPARGRMTYICRHGFGYSVFEYTENGITSELWMYVAIDAPVKFCVLKVRNNSGRPRRLSATYYAEWVLGEMRSKSLMHVVTEMDAATGALTARNPYNTEFPGRVAFLNVSEQARSVTGDRAEFLGRNGTPGRPAALLRTRLSGRVGAGFDACAAMQVPFEIEDRAEREIVFTLGMGKTADEARAVAEQFRTPFAARAALEEVWRYWNRTLSAVQVETPDPALDVLANGWLLYQTLACRMWARSAYYQSGGAFGFRDQLQDSGALLHAEPRLIREHLLRSAAHQFVEGDVQHWWHPPLNRGVRTHFSDDFLWLPLMTCRYVEGTGDTGVLDEPVTFLEGRPVPSEEDAYYDLPGRSAETGTLYEHCVRAITRGLAFGSHGLPLIGCGDWNDGMNLVGEKGQGESVWLAFFLCEVLQRFSDIAERRGDQDFADRCQTEAARLRENIEQNAWDGDWYRRAYFDNGEPLGSAGNAECQIDALPQSWAVLSGAGDPQRARQAMEAVDQRLVRRSLGLIQLFDPPFDTSALDPGYIKGYVPGVRENGGQYTHAAVWTVMAFAALGDRRRAWELFSMINPVNHANTPQGAATYKVEPYVVAADVYASTSHRGRGGWTWYTGAAGWMYRLIIESLLGVQVHTDELRIAPCLPRDWKSFKIRYRFRDTVYNITVVQSEAEVDSMRVTIDDVVEPLNVVPLRDDRVEHQVVVKFVNAKGVSDDAERAEWQGARLAQ